MNGLEDGRGAASRGTGEEAHAACDAGAFVGQDVAEGVLRDDDIEEARVLYHAHSSIINIHEVGLHIGVLAHHLLCHLSPQTAAGQYVSLIDNGQVPAALAGVLIADAQDALHLRAAVVVRVESILHTISIDQGLLLLAEVHAAGQFADADEVGAAHQLILQGGLVDEAVERLHGTYVGIEAQLLAHGQESLLGTHLGGGIVVELRVAHAGKEHGIGLLARLERLFGEGVSHLVDGMGAAECFLVTNLMAELCGHCAEHGHALLHNLGADSVTGQYCDFQFHIVIYCFDFQFRMQRYE